MTIRYDRNARLAFVGAGRLGASLALAASRAGYAVAAASSRRPEQRAWLARHVPSAQACAAPGAAAAAADIVFLCVADRAIDEVCEAIRWRSGQAVVHCAGARSLEALRAAARAGAAVGGLHPLQTFPAPGAVERLAGASFAVESADEALRAWLEQFARDLGGAPFALQAGQRAAYHASAVLASGLLLPLVGLAARLWEDFGISRERALASLLPLTSASVEALEAKGLPAAMTGPFVRGDVDTIRGHLAALAGAPDLRRAYAALALAALPLAAEQGGLSPAARAEIESLLREALDTDR
jgi:predicted short-subunit dehydrogenase-like oxidoreductase (DUF2520 family)